MTESKELATLGGGCFWCTEAVFSGARGVLRVRPGYAGGATRNPTYEEVCTGQTGHAEVIQIEFDPAKISYRDILTIFFHTHDPTTKNRQGGDSGTQYRSVILVHSPEQQQVAQELIRDLTAEKLWTGPIVTEVVPYTTFYVAEEYHHAYYKKNPERGYCQMIIAPKLAKFRHEFADRWAP
ncbi:MAG: peptide-methionine (S)-S-oxide reductase MsrA [Thermoplasmata archaeon]|nr:peptide-methionine (S)-S-oxide reductase MsrA [Thermoplasmata archaeon]